MVADSHHREKIFKIEKKISESRKNFGIHINISESKLKKKKNREKKI